MRRAPPSGSPARRPRYQLALRVFRACRPGGGRGLNRVARQPLIERPRGLGDGLSPSGKSSNPGSAAGGAKPVDVSTSAYQAGARPRRWRAVPAARRAYLGRTRSPAPHTGRRARRADRPARRGRRPPAGRGPADRRRARTERVGPAGRSHRGRAARALARIGSEHGFRRADEEGVAHAVDPRPAERRQHVVSHLLLVPDRLAARDGPCIAAATTRQSVGWEAITTWRMGWSRPVAAR